MRATGGVGGGMGEGCGCECRGDGKLAVEESPVLALGQFVMQATVRMGTAMRVDKVLETRLKGILDAAVVGMGSKIGWRETLVLLLVLAGVGMLPARNGVLRLCSGERRPCQAPDLTPKGLLEDGI